MAGGSALGSPANPCIFIEVPRRQERIASSAGSSPYPPLAAPREAVASPSRSWVLGGQLGAGAGGDTPLFLGPLLCMRLRPGAARRGSAVGYFNERLSEFAARGGGGGRSRALGLQTRTWLGRAGPPLLHGRGHRHPLGTCRDPRAAPDQVTGAFPHALPFSPPPSPLPPRPPRFSVFVCAGWGMGGDQGSQPLVCGYGLSRYRVPSRWVKAGGSRPPSHPRDLQPCSC